MHDVVARRVPLGAGFVWLYSLSIPFGALVTLGEEGRSIVVLACEVVLAGLVVHVVLSGLLPPGASALMLIAVVPLVVRLVAFEGDRGLGTVIVGHIVLGMVGGAALAALSELSPRYRRHVARAIGVGVLVCSMQVLFIVIRSPEPLAADHLSLTLPWGRSNYVGVSLAIAGYLAYTWLRQTGSRRLAVAVLLLGGSAVLATLSRGAVLALAAGIGFALVSPDSAAVDGARSRSDRRRRASLTARVALVVALAATALAGLAIVAEARTGHGDPERTIRVRQTLWALAWDGMLDAPLAGEGFGSLRTASTDELSEAHTFAHNLPMSLGQQAGALGLGMVAVWGMLTGRALLSPRLSPQERGVVMTVLVASLIEVVVEATIAGVLAWAVIWLPVARGRRSSAARDQP